MKNGEMLRMTILLRTKCRCRGFQCKPNLVVTTMTLILPN